MCVVCITRATRIHVKLENVKEGGVRERRQKSKKGGREAASWELRNLKFQVEKGESKRKVRRGGEREREKAKEAREGRERERGRE